MKTRNKTKLIYGVGINDADYLIYLTEMVAGVQKNIWVCPFYILWKNMLRRCYSGKDANYLDCMVADEWLSFLSFKKWVSRHDWEGMQLDKDILFPGNRVYGPEFCVFVTSQLNTFLLDCRSSRGKWPVGVCWASREGKFLAQCSNPFAGGGKFLGYFECPNAAHEAWRSRKHELACIYADQQADPRIAAALRSRYASQEEA